ncbi:MAG: Ig-like domain repeat protein [Terriglobales bacterium]
MAGNTVGAGSLGNRGYTGDGGPATSAEVAEPDGIALDKAGNLYVADTLNNVVRKVTASTGIITTVVGNGYGAGSLGDEGGYTGDGGPATGAELYYLRGVAVDSTDNLYIADSGNYVVRMVTAASGIIATVAGCCETDGASGIAGYLGDGGPATSAEMNSPLGIAVDSKGNFYSGDISNNVVRKVTVPPRTATTTALSSSVNPSTAGEAVTFMSAVTGSSPAGTVSFTSNGATISGCGAIILASEKAECTTTFATKGSYSIVATYSGDSNNYGSSGTLTQVVGATTTTVTSSLNPSTSGLSVTLTAAVAPTGPPTPTGTVSFTSLGAAISGCTGVALSASSTAGCTTSTLPVGTDVIAATYLGDSNYAGSSGALTQLVNPIASPVQFFPVTPCRIVDTRTADGPFGGPELAAGATRSFTIPSGPCAGIPSAAVAYSLNVTVVPPGSLGYLTIWAAGQGQPTVSTLNSLDGRTKANAAIVPAGTSGAVSVYANNVTNLLLDINGYFEAGSSSSLEFYPLTPCRLVDTRKADGPLGGPELVAATERDFPILSSTCSIPTTAKAYSLNFTVVPPATGDALDYLTVWPEGESRPIVSTLNNFTGTIVANAAIVPAGTSGGAAVYPSNATNLLIDVNGYFAAPGTGGYNLYTLTPCRVLDTRKTSGAFTDELTVNVATSSCAPSSADKAYVFNATVIPTGDLGYVTLWPDGETQPVVSTLNAEDGAITSNMAIVPDSDGKTDAYASGTTQLVLDISAYFAP